MNITCKRIFAVIFLQLAIHVSLSFQFFSNFLHAPPRLSNVATDPLQPIKRISNQNLVVGSSRLHAAPNPLTVKSANMLGGIPDLPAESDFSRDFQSFLNEEKARSFRNPSKAIFPRELQSFVNEEREKTHVKTSTLHWKNQRHREHRRHQKEWWRITKD